MAGRELLRLDVETFLYEEAALLDAWRLDDWLALFTDDAVYHVPSGDLPEDADPADHLFYIDDDRYRLQERVKRLKSRAAHVEFPHSTLLHIVTNTRLLDVSDIELKVSSNLVCYRTKNSVTDCYMARVGHRLVPDGQEGFRIRAKRVILASEGLRDQGRISVIL